MWTPKLKLSEPDTLSVYSGARKNIEAICSNMICRIKIRLASRRAVIPGHALHEKGLQRQIGVCTLVSSQERRAAVVPRINRL